MSKMSRRTMGKFLVTPSLLQAVTGTGATATLFERKTQLRTERGTWRQLWRKRTYSVVIDAPVVTAPITLVLRDGALVNDKPVIFPSTKQTVITKVTVNDELGIELFGAQLAGTILYIDGAIPSLAAGALRVEIS